MTPAPSPASAPVPSRARAADRSELEAEYLRLVRDDLPALAGAGGWIVRDDHCFGRILLDHAVGRCWYEVLDRRRVAFRQLEDDQLRAALVLARRIAAEGDSLLRRLDAQSRQWRGKPRRRGALDMSGGSLR